MNDNWNNRDNGRPNARFCSPVVCYNFVMKDDQFNDSKQFTVSTVSQFEECIEEELRVELGDRIDSSHSSLKSEITSLREEMREGFKGVGNAIKEILRQLNIVALISPKKR